MPKMDDVKKIIAEWNLVDDQIGELYENIELLGAKRDSLEEKLCDTITLTDLRPIEPGDVQEGAMYFGENSDGGFYMHFIEEVKNPNDPHKAWVASDGCRYGLDEHYVLKD